MSLIGAFLFTVALIVWGKVVAELPDGMWGDLLSNVFPVALLVLFFALGLSIMTGKDISTTPTPPPLSQDPQYWPAMGIRLRADRLERGLTLREEAARRGLDVVVLAEMERGKREPIWKADV